MIEIINSFLTPNPYSRPQRKMRRVKAIVLHWVANAGSSAEDNKNFFQSKEESYGSTHFIVGLGGEVLNIIPIDEMAYHVGAHQYSQYALQYLMPYPNDCTIGVEMCHPEWDGKFAQSTKKSTIILCSMLCHNFGLTSDEVITHEAVTGKKCPKWFVDHPQALREYRDEISELLWSWTEDKGAHFNDYD